MYQGQDLLTAKGNELRSLRKDIQIVFQDPYSSLNPRKTVRHLISEVLMVQKGCTPKEAGEKVEDLMIQVGLNPVYADRYPHEFSGGQRQRVAIAKALALQPKFLFVMKQYLPWMFRSNLRLSTCFWILRKNMALPICLSPMP